MSGRISTRPRRTKVYDCNYLASERYYRPVLDDVDRKHSGRPEPGAGLSSLRGALADAEATLGSRPRAAASPDAEPQQRRPLSALLDDDEEESSPFRRGAARRRVAASRASADEEDDAFFSSRRVRDSRARIAALEDEISATKSSRSKLRATNDFADKVLDTVGLKNSDINKARQFLEEESIFKRRSKAAAAEEEDSGSKTLSRWSKLTDVDSAAESSETAAVRRARQSRARLADLDAEMEEMESRAAARERRSANVRALLQETADVGGDAAETSTTVRSSAVRVKKVAASATAEKKTVTF